MPRRSRAASRRAPQVVPALLRVVPVLMVVASVGVVASVAVVGSAPPAAASAEKVLEGLRQDRLYVSPESALSPDRQLVRSAIAQATVPTYVAVVAQADADAEELGIDGLVLRIVDAVRSPEAVVLVFTDGQEVQAGGGEAAGRAPAEALDRVLTSRLDDPFSPETVTSAIVDWVAQVGGAAEQERASAEQPAVTRRTVGLVGLAAVAVLSLGSWLYGRSRRGVLGDSPLDDDDEDGDTSGWRGTPSQDGGTRRS